MQYSTHTEYVVFNNILVIIAVYTINSFASKFNVWPLLYLLQNPIFQILEFVLFSFCLRNIYSVTRDSVDPYLEYVQTAVRSYIAAGRISEVIFQIVSYPFRSVKKPAPAPVQHTPRVLPETDRFFRTYYGDRLHHNSVPISEVKPTITPAPVDPPSVTQNPRHITPEEAACKVLDAAYQKQPIFRFADFPSLVYTPCYQPPPSPPVKQPRRLWYLCPTDAMIEHFRLEQKWALDENWDKFDRRTCNLYDVPLKAALLNNVFLPLSESIKIYNEMLAPMYDVTKCRSRALVNSVVHPELKDCAPLNLVEIRSFLCVGGSVDKKLMKYVASRIQDLVKTRRMNGHRFYSPPGMPTDDDIIMHCLQIYLKLKEPFAIPPLVPAGVDVFKFILVYLYLTPELQKWAVF